MSAAVRVTPAALAVIVTKVHVVTVVVGSENVAVVARLAARPPLPRDSSDGSVEADPGADDS